MLTTSTAELTRASDTSVASEPPAEPAARGSVEMSALLGERLLLWAWFGAVTLALVGSIALFVLRASAPEAAWLRSFALTLLMGSAAFGAIGFYLRQSAGSRPTPRSVDAALAATTTLSLFGSSWYVPHHVRPDLIAMLVLGQLLLARAAFVPSTPRRTLLLNLACTAPIVPFTHLYFSGRLPALAHPGPLAHALFSAAFAVSIVVIGGIVSLTTERLRARTSESRKLGQYSLLEKIGGGGMGVVYKAEHTALRRPTAIKVLPREKVGEESLLRFEREARMTALLCHPNTVSVFDYGQTPGGTFYYAMEYIEGIDLELLVQHDGPQHPGRVVQILSQICGSLAEAHAIGLIHRDIKPANVFLCARAGMVDVVKVLDFGLVKRLGDGAENGEAGVVSQKVSGTPHYIAPEAILGGGDVDGRTDIYALGCVAHYLLTGLPPFSGNTVLEVLGQHLHAAPRPLTEQAPWPMSAELQQLVLSCLGKSRVQRPSDAARVYELLQGCPEARTWDEAHGRHWWSERGARVQAAIAASKASSGPAAHR